MNKNLTINDIAKMADVSKSTISRYFNGGYVKEATRKKIAEIIQKYHYEPNTFARLKAKEKKIIGIIVPCLDSHFASKMLMSADSYLSERGYISLIMNANHSSDMEIRHIHSLKQMNVDGIILSAISLTKQHKVLIDKLTIPVVVVGQNYKEYCVVNDDYQAAVSLVELIASKKYDDVLFVSVSASDEAVGKIRYQGIVDMLTQKHITFDILISDFSYEQTKQQLTKYLTQKIPRLILCSSTSQLLAAYKVIEMLNLRIPEDVAVCGFGGYEYNNLLKPHLTSLQFNTHEIGEKSAQMLLDILNGVSVQKEIIQSQLVEGSSI